MTPPHPDTRGRCDCIRCQRARTLEVLRWYTVAPALARFGLRWFVAWGQA